MWTREKRFVQDFGLRSKLIRHIGCGSLQIKDVVFNTRNKWDMKQARSGRVIEQKIGSTANLRRRKPARQKHIKIKGNQTIQNKDY